MSKSQIIRLDTCARALRSPPIYCKYGRGEDSICGTICVQDVRMRLSGLRYDEVEGLVCE